ncbi:putative SAM-dependent methyltransferases [Vibrio astriarenae]|nr:putative SAM-dependent methyltransferases [Vibrio sp. C7]
MEVNVKGGGMNERATVKGQAIYSKIVLSIYDFWVLGISNHYFWKCPTRTISNHFVDCVSQNHLDVGVGTGYYLKDFLPPNTKRIALMDMNKNSLDKAERAINNFLPEVYQVDVMNMSDLCIERFDSISVNYLLHCLPGVLDEKSMLFSNIKPFLNDEGVLFGSTILGKGVKVGFFANRIMNFYNKKGVFSNLHDDIESLSICLNKHFYNVDIKIVGCVALFSCKNSKYMA